MASQPPQGGAFDPPLAQTQSATSDEITLMVLFAPGSQSPAEPSWRCTTNLKSYSPPGRAMSSDHESPGAQSMPVPRKQTPGVSHRLFKHRTAEHRCH